MKIATKPRQAADIEIARLDAMLTARRALRDAEQALEDEQARHARLKALIGKRVAVAQEGLDAAMRHGEL